MPNFINFPFGFWLSAALLIGLALWGWNHRKKGWGLPGIGVCLTVLIWYHGDALYNDYFLTYTKEFPSEILNVAWLQVALFALAFGGFVSYVPDFVNARYRGQNSQVEALLSGQRSLDRFQSEIKLLSTAVVVAWLGMFCVALWRTDGDVVGLIAPYLGEMAHPWARGQISQSWFDSLAIVFGTVATVCAALFGVCAALSKPVWAQSTMVFFMIVSWPSYFLDRTRNVMLVVLLPGLLATTFLRLRNHRLIQVGLLVGVFLGLNAWFKFVIANRSEVNIVTALVSKSDRAEPGTGDVKHLGLNMFEELCYLNQFITSGEFTPDNGQNYLGSLINPIPRALWPGKPTLGLEYSIARGQGGDTTYGVTGTVATGMVGSGIVNFGKTLGPIAAAFLMSLWCAWLARLDLTGEDVGRLSVYMIGLVGIFNFGRDVTILAAYPALFGFGLLWVWRKYSPNVSAAEEQIVATVQPDKRRGRRASNRRMTMHDK